MYTSLCLTLILRIQVAWLLYWSKGFDTFGDTDPEWIVTFLDCHRVTDCLRPVTQKVLRPETNIFRSRSDIETSVFPIAQSSLNHPCFGKKSGKVFKHYWGLFTDSCLWWPALQVMCIHFNWIVFAYSAHCVLMTLQKRAFITHEREKRSLFT